MLKGFKKNIESFQKDFNSSLPINNSLNVIPAKIAPTDKKIRGINITNGDSCVSSILISLLLYSP